MSRRPRIESKHEKRVERGIQSARKARDRQMAATPAVPLTAQPEPYIHDVGRGPLASKIPASVQRWIDEESREQLKHYRRIFREIEALGPLRDVWVKEFYERITGPRGFSVHAGLRKTIPKADIPARPNRPWRVVW